MALYGSSRDISLIRRLNRELISRIIEQKIGYYKVDLNSTDANLYGESTDKFYHPPVLLDCLIQRGDHLTSAKNYGPDIDRKMEFRFLRDDLVDRQLVPEIGDVIVWNDDYYEIDGYVENQLFVGKDPSYPYADNLFEFGTSLSIILSAHYMRPEKVNLNRTR